ncbi:MAG: sulfurtransferase [Actinomycetota bacterium]
MPTPTLPGPLVDAGWLADHITDVVVCDTRWYLDGRSGAAAFSAGHIPGAVFVDLDTDLSAPAGPDGRHPLPTPEAFAGAMGRLGVGHDSVVVAYDDAGGMVAGRMWWMLDALGVACAVLDGGIDAWPGELELQPRQIVPTTFPVVAWPPDRFASADEVADLAGDVRVIDARAAERYRGEENAVDPRFGHIPGARSAPFAANLDGGRFKEAAELAAHYESLGIETDTPVVAYCGSGVSACVDLLALRLVGSANTRLYVGSWSEWGGDEGRPLATGAEES